MALDYGERRIGVALSDPTGCFASPADLVERRDDGSHFGVLQRLCETNDVAEVIVGLPLHLSGEEGKAAQLAREFAGQLAERVGVPVNLVDERLTTVEAERALLEGDVSRRKRKCVVDSLSAVVLLNSYLGRRGTAQNEGA